MGDLLLTLLSNACKLNIYLYDLITHVKLVLCVRETVEFLFETVSKQI